MRQYSRVLVLPLLLVACTSFDTLDKKLPYFKGKKIDEAISYLGHPNDERAIAGKTVYTWSTAYTQTSMTPITTQNSGMINGKYYSGTSQSYVPETSNLSCVLRMITDKKRIIDIDYEGNNGACFRYSRKLESMPYGDEK